MKQLLYQVIDADSAEEFFGTVRSEAEKISVSSMLFHFYCGTTDVVFIEDIRRRIVEAFPQAQIAGTTSNGEILEGHLMDQGLLLGVLLFEKSDVQVTYYKELRGNEGEYGADVRKLIGETADVKAVELLLEGPPANTGMLLDLIQQCSDDITIFGGYSIGHDIGSDRKLLVTKDGILENALLVIMYSGKELHINANYTLGWVPLGHAFKITKCKGNLLQEINGKPAYDIYQKYLQISLDEKSVENTTEFPLLVKKGKIEFLRHPNACLEDGTMALSGYVQEGMDVYLTYGNPTKIIKEVDRRCAAIREFEPEAIVLRSCALRKIFWRDFVDKEVEPFQKMAETGGFYTGGELLRVPGGDRIMEFNLTLVSIAMREGEKKGLELPDARVDDTMLSGQASLLMRLANLVQITTEELIDTSERFARMAETDELTGLYNRREISARIHSALDASAMFGQRSCLIMLDIDYFKKVNDTFGHTAGDHALKEVAKIMRSYANEEMGGCAGRWGGEEFFLLLPGLEIKESMEIVEKMRKEVEEHDFGEAGHLTVSMGVIACTGLEERRRIFTQVDEALYQAKQMGRNRAILAESVV
ncbi:MAG: GGDEF domain-containing protein [Lachnospiraceae bacterium]|nr:GGDEF domain-containing protein [Lachnospiraceae bacterium]